MGRFYTEDRDLPEDSTVIIHTAELPIVLTNGNDGRGGRWFRSAKVRTLIEEMLRCDGHVRSTPFSGPVSLLVTRVLGPRQSLWDADSWQRGNLKEVIDALVVVGWFVDDGPKWITEVRCLQLVRKQRPKQSFTIIDVIQEST